MAKKTDDAKQILLTAKGLKKLQDELADLSDRGRKDVAKRLKEAIAYGDLSENAEYDEAKNQQAFIEQRIAILEEQIRNAKVVKESKGDVVQIGSKVTLKVGGEKHEFVIVGSTEADSMSHKISNESPVGEAILGKKKKEKVIVKAPGGEFEYEILDIK
jgi:transcription elongation factor GreA